MKKVLIASILLTGISFGAMAQKIKGSDTVLPLSQKLAEQYMKKHPKQSVVVTGGGSGVGISALLTGTTEIAQASRKIKFDERQKLQADGKKAKEVVIAYDALAVVVHPSNKVSQLTREQLQDIFTGKIKNWKEVGGEDMRIVAYSRETSSGTYEFFKESVLKSKNYMNGIMSLPAQEPSCSPSARQRAVSATSVWLTSTRRSKHSKCLMIKGRSSPCLPWTTQRTKVIPSCAHSITIMK